MVKKYKTEKGTVSYPEDPASVKKAKDELQALIDAEAPQPTIDEKRGEIQRLYRYEDDKLAGKIKKKGVRLNNLTERICLMSR